MCDKNCPDCVCNNGDLPTVVSVADLYRSLLGAEEGIYVKFEKMNGDVTTRKMTLNSDIIPEEGLATSRETPETVALTYEERVMDIRSKDYVSVWSITDNGWRTGKPSKIIYQSESIEGIAS